MILLDTQALVWLIEDDPSLGALARQAEAASDRVLVSSITLWEIGLLVSRGRLTLRTPFEQWVDKVEQEAGIELLDVTRAIAMDAGTLPAYNHGDPGDRIVLASARNLSCPVMTSDGRMLAYAETGHVRAIDATR